MVGSEPSYSWFVMEQGWENSISTACVLSNDSLSDARFLLDIDTCVMGRGDASLRQWLDTPHRSVDHLECLHVFRQIVEIVDLAHSQGVVVHNIRPSCFIMSCVNRVSFIESASCSSSGSDSCEDAPQCSLSPSVRRTDSEDLSPNENHADSSQRVSDASCLQSSVEEAEDDSSNAEGDGNGPEKSFPMKKIMMMELSWYTSPEEVDGAQGCYSSDVYRLGVLLFEVCGLF